MSRAKIGRNDPCPCGGGKKYKRCHGFITQVRAFELGKTLAARAEVARVQRERQQGLGKPIISATFKGERFVAVKNRLFHSSTFRTFHDFLLRYITAALGTEWGNAEIAKPVDQHHPIIVWYQALCAHQRTFMKESGKVKDGPWTGATAAYLHLAYDLYALDHNAELQERLVARLRNRETFTGARYEVYVAAIFVRAGFDIAFENEQDGSTTHCEFTATNRRTGKRFSVEAKRREGRRLRIGHLFNDALTKRANHTRVIFIDVNSRDDAHDQLQPVFLKNVLRRLRFFEGQTLNGRARPPAYVFLTNAPWEHYLEMPAPRCTVLAEGFQIPDFKEGVWMPSLRHIIDAREAHIEMHGLIQSIKDHSDIPSTFDGEIPEYAFNQNRPRIIVGSRFMVKDQGGIDQPATVTAATVSEEERVAVCGITFEDGRSAIWKAPLSDEEMIAWRRHPDTFFGVLSQRTTRADTPLELYDFFHESCKRSTREQLLEALADAPDFATLAELDQPRLASIHAERLTYGAMAQATAMPSGIAPKAKD